MKKAAIVTLKLVLPAGLFVYLLWNVDRQDYQAFWNQQKRWDQLFGAQLLALTAVVLTFFRWRMLVLAFGIPFTVRECLRLGFLGYMLNFVSVGSVGGDVFKAILVARDKSEKRPEAIASVLLDRALGLLGLVMLAWASLTFLAVGVDSMLLSGIRRAAGLLTLAAILSLLIAIFAGRWFERMLTRVERLPLAGETLARMARAVRMLRNSPIQLFSLILLSVFIHLLFASSIYLVSAGIYRDHPSLSEHLLVVPPGLAAGTLPLAPGGIGLQEGALAGLFAQLPRLPETFSGVLVATVFRLITIAITGIGLVYYWASHGREFQFAEHDPA